MTDQEERRFFCDGEGNNPRFVRECDCRRCDTMSVCWRYAHHLGVKARSLAPPEPPAPLCEMPGRSEGTLASPVDPARDRGEVVGAPTKVEGDARGPDLGRAHSFVGAEPCSIDPVLAIYQASHAVSLIRKRLEHDVVAAEKELGWLRLALDELRGEVDRLAQDVQQATPRAPNGEATRQS